MFVDFGEVLTYRDPKTGEIKESVVCGYGYGQDGLISGYNVKEEGKKRNVLVFPSQFIGDEIHRLENFEYEEIVEEEEEDYEEEEGEEDFQEEITAPEVVTPSFIIVSWQDNKKVAYY